MAQVINGKDKYLTADAMAVDVGMFRSARSNWNFTEDTGAIGAYTIFTLTGDVYIEQIYGLCQVTVTGAGSVEVGIAGDTDAFILTTVGANILQYNLWQNATPTANPGVVVLLGRSWTVCNSANVIFTISGAVLTAGDIDFHCTWRPLTLNGNLVAA